MNTEENRTGIAHTPGVVPAEDPATGEPDPSVLKEVSEQASLGNMRPSEELAAETEKRRAQVGGGPLSESNGQKNSESPEGTGKK